MTPKEKAKELIDKFIEHTQEWDELDGYVNDIYKAKKCALIAVDTVLWMASHYATIEYWQEVKQEIQAL
jgi:hypothetical protein